MQNERLSAKVFSYTPRKKVYMYQTLTLRLKEVTYFWNSLSFFFLPLHNVFDSASTFSRNVLKLL